MKNKYRPADKCSTLFPSQDFLQKRMEEHRSSMFSYRWTKAQAWSKLQVALTALPVFGFAAFGQRHDLMVGKHSGLVSQLPAGAAQWLTASVTEVHHPFVLHENKHKSTGKMPRLSFFKATQGYI